MSAFPFTAELARVNEAEAKWQAELERAFGRDACDARYQPRGKGAEDSPLRKAHDALELARLAWLASA